MRTKRLLQYHSYRCELCPYSTDIIDDFFTHLEVCNIVIKSKDESDNISAFTSGFKELLCTNNLELYLCSSCSYATMLKTELHLHQKQCQNGATVVPSCETYFETSDGFIYKQKTTNKVSRKPPEKKPKQDLYNCDKCDYTTHNEYAIKQHNTNRHATVDEITWFECAYCTYRAKQKGNLKTHVRNKHFADEDLTSWYHCKHCDYRSRHKGNVKTHEKTKHGDAKLTRRFKCEHCPYRAKQKGILKTHMANKHDHVTLLECAECGFRTPFKSALKIHEREQHSTGLELDFCLDQDMNYFKCY